jgi:hypothetical protein
MYQENERNLDAPGVNYSYARWCRWCGYPIHGRHDKRYCDIHCKNSWHRWLKAKGLHGPLQRILRNNWRVLEMFCSSGKSRTTLQALQENGFLPKFHTHIDKGPDKKNYTFCFNYGWCSMQGKGNWVMIIRQDGESLN